MKVYISGQITGLPYDQVRHNFEQAQQIIEAWQYTAVNPLTNGLPYDSPWTHHMVRDIYMLFGCQAIYLLPDWTKSKGARIEEFIAREMGLIVFNHNSSNNETEGC